MNKPDFIQGILLAAGQGSRFGGDKLLHRLPEGEGMALASARHLRQSLPSTLAVLRPDRGALRAELEEQGFRCVVALQAERGMGHSVAAGVAASADAVGWVVALADMPYVQPSTIAAIADALRAGHDLVAPIYQGRRGNPVGFSAKHREDLLALAGDAGARHLLQAHREHVHVIEVDDPGVIRDIDTPQDLAAGGNTA